ncbi:MAG: hypothetical protein J6M58_01145 [Clostridium sp.]|jgi:hypothetical protein|nr:hypothetical protein [Clostridium sp.]MBP3214818.1 hypothetical protein [Clostridium sp.]MBQ4149248.1 hypothetical protein [Clostridium sp.]MBQ5421390.1 hypothetical protein [Clostridium sp.]
MSDDRIIDFEEELSHYQPSLEVSAVGDAIVEADLTDMSDIMLELMKQMRD